MSLALDALDVVVAMRAGELGVRRAVAGLALQAAVAGREAIEREAGGRRVGVGREGLVDGLRGRGPAHRTPRCSGSGRCCWSPCRCGSSGRSARRASRVRVGAATVAHRAVTALALHRQRAVGGDGGAHGAAQAARHRARMAAVAGGAVVARVERQAVGRIDHAAACRPWIAWVSGAIPAGRCPGAPRRRGSWRTGWRAVALPWRRPAGS